MPEKSFPVLVQVPDNRDIDKEYDEKSNRVVVYYIAAGNQFKDFDWNKKSRLPDRKQDRPFGPKCQSESFDEQK